MDHNTGDVSGACSLVFAKTEPDAREYLNQELVKHGLLPYQKHKYTLYKLPIYRECIYFINAKQSENLTEQIRRESGLLPSRISIKQMSTLKLYFVYNDRNAIRGGVIIISSNKENAYNLLKKQTQDYNNKFPNDSIGLYTLWDDIEKDDIHEFHITDGKVIMYHIQ
jgi:hypothetical protein